MVSWRRSVWISLMMGCGGWAHAEDKSAASSPVPDEPAAHSQLPNIKTKTLGGVQFWGDVTFCHGWHIQRNVFTGHHRLLDEHDVRHAWGTREQCEEKLREICEQQKLPSMKGTAVVLLHGLGRSDKSVSRLKQHFEKAGYYTIAVNYPSLRASIPENGDYLHEVLQSLHGIEKVHLIGFSMGGVVIRQCLSAHSEPRLGRVVLIGTPNQGAELATVFRDWWAYKAITGPSGQQLSTVPHGLAAKLPAPQCEFGIIAGCRGADGGYNPLIPGDDDGTVSLESTRLGGAADFFTVHAIHQTLLHTPAVFEAAHHFLEQGRFHAEIDPVPIPKADPEKEALDAGKAAVDSPPKGK